MNYRQRIIKLFTFLGGLYFFLEFILPKSIAGYEFGKYNTEISYGFSAIAAAAFGLGLINLFAIHGGKVVFQRKGWFNSLALLAGLLLMIFVSTGDWLVSLSASKKSEKFFELRDFSIRIKEDLEKNTPNVPAPEVRVIALQGASKNLLNDLQKDLDAVGPESSQIILAAKSDLIDVLAPSWQAVNNLGDTATWAELDGRARLDRIAATLGDLGTKGGTLWNAQYEVSHYKRFYGFLYDGLFVALGSSMFALLGFYIASAAYRAFRVRSFESALMMTAAVLVMLGQIPFGLWISESLPGIRSWLLETPSAAAFRAIKLGAGVAALIMAFRMWLSIESDKFGAKE